MRLTRDQLADIREDAEWTSRHVGAPGCQIRERAEATLTLLDEFVRLRNIAAACPDCTWEIKE